MKKRKELLIIIALLAILAANLLSGSVWAKEIKTGSKAKLDEGTVQSMTGMTLLESSDGSTWTTMIGDLASGFIMPLDPANTYEYLDVETLTGTAADGDYGFILDELDVPDDFYSYWAGKGVVAGATGWQGIMWEIINGRQPMFYLRIVGAEYDLIDGLSYLLDGPTTTEKLKVNGDYTLGHYTFEGTVDGQYMIVDITFTQIATVSIVGDTFTIDGCGYIDLYIHLENVHNLYALDVSVAFDETMVEVMDLDDSALGDNLEPVSDWFDAGYWAKNEASNDTGEIRYATTLTRPSEPVDGSGNVAKIRLRTKGFGTSAISVTAATLSDRDGYLVGVPVELGSETITTQFTTAGGLDLGITRLNAGTVQLNWPAQAVDEVETFTLHRSTLPYFTPDPTPDTGTIYQTITNQGTVDTFDDPVLGNVDDNYFYTMQITCDSGLESPYAWQVGKFEYTLYETNTTDFTWVGFVLENDGIYNSQTLANHVEDNIFSGQVSVKKISRWNANGQGYTTYNHTTGTSIFPVSVKYPYRVEIDITDPVTTNNTVIWAQVGRLPEITENTFTLYETNTTDFTWVLQPLDMVSVTNTLQLADHIRANSSASINVLTIGRWNGTGQSVTSINTPVGGTNYFDTRFGYPYRIESDIVTGTTVTWP